MYIIIKYDPVRTIDSHLYIQMNHMQLSLPASSSNRTGGFDNESSQFYSQEEHGREKY
jgi:hypothetical protein